MSRDKFFSVPDVAVEDLLLDTKNPRIRRGADQNDCIARILRDRENFLNLLKDVGTSGLSPEHILVSADGDGKWVVRDGNRRVTVLKLLNRPDLCPSELAPIVRRVAQAANGAIPTAIACLGCKDEETILAYLERKHTGENAGIGQVNWSPLLKSLFNLQLGVTDQNKRAAQLVLWAEGQGFQVEDDFFLTTLTRALNADTLRLLGFAVQKDELAPTLPANQAYALAARVLSDIGSGRVHVRRDDADGSIYLPEAQIAYFTRLREELGPPLHRPGASTPPPGPATPAPPAHGPDKLPDRRSGPPDAPTSVPETDAGEPPPAPRRSPSPTTPSWDRPGLFSRGHPGFSVPSGHTKVANIIAELKKLKVKETPQAVAMVFRTLIELSEEYYRKSNGITEADALHKRIARAADHMHGSQALSDGQYEVLIRRTREEGGMLHATTLHKYVHSADFHPNYQTLNTLWDEIGCFVASCWR